MNDKRNRTTALYNPLRMPNVRWIVLKDNSLLCLCINETATDNHETTYQATKKMDTTLALSAWVHRFWHHWLTWWLNTAIKPIPLVEDKPKI
jgi:hypothetical protein